MGSFIALLGRRWRILKADVLRARQEKGTLTPNLLFVKLSVPSDG